MNNDEDFTTGINLHFYYKSFFKKSIFPSFGASEDWQLGRTVSNSNIMGFGSLLYTPKNLGQKSVIDTMDRPFASFQYLTIGRSSILKMWNPWLDKKITIKGLTAGWIWVPWEESMDKVFKRGCIN